MPVRPDHPLLRSHSCQPSCGLTMGVTCPQCLQAKGQKQGGSVDSLGQEVAGLESRFQEEVVDLSDQPPVLPSLGL